MDFSAILKTVSDLISSVVSGVGNAVKKATHKVLGTSYGFQLTAKIMPYSTCFSHSVANMLSAIGISVKPDEVTATVNSQEYQNWVRQNVSWATAYIGRLQTVWQVQERYINQMLAKHNKTQFKSVMNWSTSRDYIIESINLGIPVVSDSYPTYFKTGQQLGHIIAIVGFAMGYIPKVEDFQTPEQFNDYVARFGSGARDCYIIDDPFGNMLSGYVGNESLPKPIIGDDLIIPFEWFDTGIRGKFSLTLRSK